MTGNGEPSGEQPPPDLIPMCPAAASPSFIGSFPEDRGQAVIVLRGEIDARTVDRLATHVEDLLAVDTRFLAIDAAAVDRYGAGLLDLLGRVQHRLGARRGLLTVRGLHPCLLDAATAPSREATPADPPAPPPMVAATGRPAPRPTATDSTARVGGDEARR